MDHVLVGDAHLIVNIVGHVPVGDAHLKVYGVGHVLVGDYDLVGLGKKPIDNFSYIVNVALNKLLSQITLYEVYNQYRSELAILLYTWYKLSLIIPLNELYFEIGGTSYFEKVAGFQVLFLYSSFRAISS